MKIVVLNLKNKKKSMKINYFETGIAFFNHGDYKRAVEFLTKFIAENPEHSEAYENRAIAYYHLNEDDKAIEDLNKAIEIDPQNENALINRGLHYFEKKDYDQALDNYLAAYEIYNSLETLKNIIDAYMQKGHYHPAKPFCKRLLNASPNDKWAIRAYADIHAMTNNYEEAIEYYNKILKHEPANSEILNAIGYYYMKLGDLDQSEFYYKTAIQYDSEYAYPVNNWGHLEYLRKNYYKALELINKSIKIDPSNSFAFKNRALVYLAEGNKEAAYEDLMYASELGFKDYWGDEVDNLIRDNFSNETQ